MTLAEIDPLWQRIICLVAPAAEAGLPQVRGCRGFPGDCECEVHALVLRQGTLLVELGLLYLHIGCLLRCQMRPAVMQAGARIMAATSMCGRALPDAN